MSSPTTTRASLHINLLCCFSFFQKLVTFHNLECHIHNGRPESHLQSSNSKLGDASLSNFLPSKRSEHDRTAMLPFRSETTAVSTSIRTQSATNLCDGSQ